MAEENNNSEKKEVTEKLAPATANRAVDVSKISKAFSKSSAKQDGVLRYPYEALTRHTDYLQINIVEYESVVERTGGRFIGSNRGFAKTGGAGRARPRGLANKALKNTGTILLPIPNAVQDGNTVSVASSKLNGLEAAGAAAVWTAMGGTGEESKAEINDLQSGLASIGSDFKRGAGQFVADVKEGAGSTDAAKRLILQKMTSAAVGLLGGNITAQQLMARTTGEILNPNIEVLFDGPGLRNFKFSYKMMPRNVKEAEQIKLIIRTFKQNMSPKTSAADSSRGGNFFMKSPNIFELQYMTGNDTHDYLHRFKQCFLTDFSVNYTAENSHMTYNDGSPVSYIMDLSFKEIEPIYYEDYDSGQGGESVGY